MPITGNGWEFHMIRTENQTRLTATPKTRTVGTYQVYHNGVAQTATDLSGMFAETRGPGNNGPSGINKRRIEAGRYPLATQDGGKYCTIDYTSNGSPSALRRPSLELLETGDRTEILIHPGQGFVWSIGCINPCTSLPDWSEPITFSNSRRRTISIIDDLADFLGGGFPAFNGRRIPNAHFVIDNEP